MCPFKRVNYFTGQLLTAADFQAEQKYFLDKTRWHNRVLHGDGVAHGFKVTVGKDGNGSSVTVAPGQALDQWGRELDLCAPVRLRLPKSTTTVLVLARYTERFTDDAPVITGSGAESQPTRVEESCEIVFGKQAPSGAKTARRGAAGSKPPDVVLARLVRRQGGWRLDRRFKVPRTR